MAVVLLAAMASDQSDGSSKLAVMASDQTDGSRKLASNQSDVSSKLAAASKE